MNKQPSLTNAHISTTPKTTLHCINLKKKRLWFVKGSLFHCLHRVYRCNIYSLQNESLYLMLIHPVWFTANGLPVLKNILRKKINHQLFSAHSLKKGRRGAYMKIIFLASELMLLLWTNQPSKFSNSHHSLSIFHLNLISCLYNPKFFFYQYIFLLCMYKTLFLSLIQVHNKVGFNVLI